MNASEIVNMKIIFSGNCLTVSQLFRMNRVRERFMFEKRKTLSDDEPEIK